MAMRLSDALGASPELWTGMQAQHELWEASRRQRRKIRTASKVANVASHLLRQIILNADVVDEGELLFQIIDVLFFIG